MNSYSPGGIAGMLIASAVLPLASVVNVPSWTTPLVLPDSVNSTFAPWTGLPVWRLRTRIRTPAGLPAAILVWPRITVSCGSGSCTAM